jgi:hypothetical protein
VAVADEGLHAGIGLRALVGREKVWIGERCVGGVGDGKADAARAVSREPGFASQRPGQLAAVGVEPGAVFGGVIGRGADGEAQREIGLLRHADRVRAGEPFEMDLHRQRGSCR